MFSGWFSSKPNKVPDRQRFLKIEFMTEEEKINKTVALDRLKKKHNYEDDTIHNPDIHYKVSFRETFTFKDLTPGQQFLTLSEVLSKLVENEQGVVEYQAIHQFYNSYVQQVTMILSHNRALKPEDKVILMDYQQKLAKDNTKTLQIIFKRKGWLSRLKGSAGKAIKNLPGYFARLVAFLARIFLGLLGLDSVGSAGYTIAKSLINTKQLVHYLLTTLCLFFPMLAPLMPLVKFI